MRTTLAIDDDVPNAAKNLATRQGKSVGKIISSLARQALHPAQPLGTRNGIPLLTGNAAVTPEAVEQLRDQLME